MPVFAFRKSGSITPPPPPPPGAPAAPMNLAAAVLADRVVLTWDQAPETGISGYTVFRGGVAIAGASPSFLGTNSYTDTSVVAGSSYVYRVTVTKAGLASPQSGGATATIPVAAPAAPGALSLSHDQAGIQVTWASVSGATSYKLGRSTISGGPYTIIDTTSGTSFTDASVAQGILYYYVLTAVGAGGESALSPQASHRIPLPTGEYGSDVTKIEIYSMKSFTAPIEEGRVQLFFDREVRAGQNANGDWWIKKAPADPDLNVRVRVGPLDGNGICQYQPTRARLYKALKWITPGETNLAYKSNKTIYGSAWDTQATPVAEKILLTWTWWGGGVGGTTADGSTTFGLVEKSANGSTGWTLCTYPEDLTIVTAPGGVAPYVQGPEYANRGIRGSLTVQYIGTTKWIRMRMDQTGATFGVQVNEASGNFLAAKAATYDTSNPGANSFYHWGNDCRHGVMKNLIVERAEATQTSKWGFDTRTGSGDGNINTGSNYYDGNLSLGDPTYSDGGWIPLQAGDTLLCSQSRNPTQTFSKSALTSIYPYGNTSIGIIPVLPTCNVMYMWCFQVVEEAQPPTRFAFPPWTAELSPIKGRDTTAYLRKLGTDFSSSAHPFLHDSSEVDVSWCPSYAIPASVFTMSKAQVFAIAASRKIWWIGSRSGETFSYADPGGNYAGTAHTNFIRNEPLMTALMSDSYTTAEKKQLAIGVVQNGLDLIAALKGGAANMFNGNEFQWLWKWWIMATARFLNRVDIAQDFNAPYPGMRNFPKTGLNWLRTTLTDDGWARDPYDPVIPPDVNSTLKGRGTNLARGQVEAADYYSGILTPNENSVIMNHSEDDRGFVGMHPDYVASMALLILKYEGYPTTLAAYQASDIFQPMAYNRYDVSPYMAAYAVIMNAWPAIRDIWDNELFFKGGRQWMRGSDAGLEDAYNAWNLTNDIYGLPEDNVSSDATGTILTRHGYQASSTDPTSGWHWGNGTLLQDPLDVGRMNLVWNYGGARTNVVVQEVLSNLRYAEATPDVTKFGQIRVSPSVPANQTGVLCKMMWRRNPQPRRGSMAYSKLAEWLWSNGHAY